MKSKFKMKLSLFEHFLELAQFDGCTSRLVCLGTEFVGEYAFLKFENGVSWARASTRSNKIQRYKYIYVNASGKVTYSKHWSPSEDEKTQVRMDISDHAAITGKGTKTVLMKVYGLNNPDFTSYHIRKDIRDWFKDAVCCVCGNTSNIEVDHKNDCYNDHRVLKVDTQCVNDFQALCRHCNLQKRQAKKIREREGKRYPASRIPSIAVWGIDFTKGDSAYNPEDIHTLIGTYWYDPVAFCRDVHFKARQTDRW